MQLQYKNFSKKYLWIFPLIFLTLITQTIAECNVCTLRDMACISKTKFQFCEDNKPSGTIYKCGDNQGCDLNGKCVKTTNIIYGCNDCNVCHVNKTFACTGINTFALCLGTTGPGPITGTCNNGYTCSLQNPLMCGDKNIAPTTCSEDDDVTGTTTTTVGPTATAPSPIEEPNKFCGYVNETGRFPVGTDPKTTCRQFIHCYNNTNVWTGARYYCYGTYYYNDATKLCEKNLPPRCSSRIKQLTLFDLELN